jgi:serine protease Do
VATGLPLTNDNGLVQATGFVVHRSGLIVTSFHAVQGHRRIAISMSQHRQCDAEVVAWDPITDVALLRLNGRWDDLVPLPLGDSDCLRAGDPVLILGNPFDYALSAAQGIVSHVGRHLREHVAEVSNPYLQFTSPVHPGNSGGPLFNSDGEVIGVVSRSSTLASGISFALPSNLLRRVLDQFRTDGGHDRGWIGMCFVGRDAGRAGGRVDGIREAVEVTQIVGGSPCQRAGVQRGDLIIGYDQRPVAKDVAAPAHRKRLHRAYMARGARAFFIVFVFLR